MKKLVTKILPIFLVMLMVLSACPLQAAAASSGTFTPVDGVSVTVSKATNTSMSSGVITTTAKGSAGILGYGASAKTATITVYNDSDEEAVISFDWTATSVNSLTIDGATKNDSSGSFSKLMASDESITITVTTATDATVNTFVMKNFKFASGGLSFNFNLEYNEDLGSVTLGGAAVGSGYTQSVNAGESLALVATAKNSTFLGWADQNNKLLSKAATYSLTPSEDITVKAIFADLTPWFLVGGEYLCEGLTAATQKAASASNKAVVLMNNGTLPAGDYTIPAGVTLLIPFDSANTLYTDEPATTGAKFVAPTVYRELTMASGANITVNGAISVSSKVVSGSAGTNGFGAGLPSGPYGHIKMEENANITLNNGANLYTWGYITGKGSVLAKSGATVYECFQGEDYRGGQQTTGMKNKVFPMSQYYIQNIEVPLTFEAGAAEKTYTNITVTLLGEQGSDVDFIGSSDAMFNLVSGSATKYYDGTKDRLYVELNGSVEMSPISMKVGVQSLNSSNYVLPVTNNLTVKVNTGSSVTITQDIAVLPGAEIIVEENALCKIGAGHSIYAYDADQWGTYCYKQGNKKFVPLEYAPSRTYTRTEADLVDAKVVINGTIDATEGYLYTTAGGANVYSTGNGKIKAQPGTATVTYQLSAQDIDSNKNDTYASIPITSAKLKNADGSMVETAGSSGEYDYIDGVWKKTCYTHVHSGSVTTPAGCETEGLRTFTCECGDTYTETIAATGHTAGADATCDTAQTCTVCGKELASALGHSEVVDEAVAPTCTQAGLSEGKHCSVCGEVIIAQQVIDAHGHSYGEWRLADVAREDSNGWFEKTCSSCGDVQKDEFPYIKAKDVLVTVTESGKNIEIFVDAAYLEQLSSITAFVSQNGNGVQITDYVKKGNRIVFVYNTSSAETLEIGFEAITKNGNPIVADPIFKNIDRVDGNVGEMFVVPETLEGSDANGDGKTDIKDLVRLKKMVTGIANNTESADLSGDGNVGANDIVLLAKYLVRGKRGLKAYTVTFADSDGTVLETQIVIEGFSAKPEGTPIKDGFVFAGWDGNFVHVMEDMVITATYQ